MINECQHIQNLFGCKHNMDILQGSIITCNHEDIDIGIGLTGIGMVNAAHTFTKIIENLNYIPKYVINTGCCGAHDENSKIEDVVIGLEYIPLANIIIDNNRTHYYGTREQDKIIKTWHSDSDLVKIANYSITSASENFGIIGSSDIWHNNLEKINWWHKEFDTKCEDMEAAALAQIADKYNISFISIKDISNSIYIQNTKQFNGYDHDVPSFAGLKSAEFALKIINNHK